MTWTDKAACNAVNGDAAVGPAAKKRRLDGHTLPTAVVLDIEGTVLPLSFVADTLFP